MHRMIAIVEDMPADADLLMRYFDRYSQDSGDTFQIQHFRTGAEFLAAYQPIYDIVFMDIELPGRNGMDTATALRKLDNTVTLIFVTNLVRYAAQGYDVDAMAFLLKPVSYENFSLKLQRALSRCSSRSTPDLCITTSDGIRRISTSRVKYIETSGHYLIYHTTEGDFTSYGNMKDAEAVLDATQFIRCNRCYLVNMAFVRAIRGQLLVVDGEELQISRPRRNAVMEALNLYLGGVS